MLLAGLAGRPPIWPVIAVHGEGEGREAFAVVLEIPLLVDTGAVPVDAVVVARPVDVASGVDAAEPAFAIWKGAGEGLALVVFADC